MLKTFWKIGVLSFAAMLAVAGEAAAQRQSGIQRTPDGARVLVSKDVGGQRYAITLNVADGTVTGNVFSTDGSAPQFISCAPTGPIGSNAFDCRVAATCDPSAARQSGIQRAFDSAAVLVSKDVGEDRFAITQNLDGTLTGNVFSTESGNVSFLFCTPNEAGGYTCAFAASCTTLPCTEQFLTLDQSITLPDTFFTLPASCVTYGPPIAITLPKTFFVPDPELLREAARLAIVNNPFRTTNVENDDQLPKNAPINDLILAVRNSATPPVKGETASCPGGGSQTLVNCEDRTVDGVRASLSTILFDDCTVGSPELGFIVQKGTIQMLAPASPCILVTALNLPVGIEINELRDNFETTFFNGPGLPTEVDLEVGTGFVTHSNACPGVDLRFRPNVRRDLLLTTRSDISVVPGVGASETIFRGYDVTIAREYSQDCGTRTTTLTGRRISTSDGRSGELYAAGFDDLKYAMKDGSSFSIDGGLTEGCSGGNRSYTYRTITSATFDRDGDGCPRGGAFELSVEGTVIGQLAFTDAGGVTLTPVAGAPLGLPSCNDPALRLTTCPLD